MNALKNHPHCKVHINAKLVEDHNDGDLVCPVCGTVVCHRVIDMSNEWRSFADDDNDKSRVGMEEKDLFESVSAGTIISQEINSTDAVISNFRKFSRISPIQRMLKSVDDHIEAVLRNLFPGSNTAIGKYAKELSQVIIQGVKKSHDADETKKKFSVGKHNKLAALCVYLALQNAKVHFPKQDICTAGSISKTDLKKALMKFRPYLTNMIFKENKSTDLVEGLVMKLMKSETNYQVKSKLVGLARIICDQVRDIRSCIGKSPITIAVASIYMSLQILEYPNFSKDYIAQVLNCSKPTFTALYKVLVENRHEILPKENYPEYAHRIDNLPKT